MRSFLVAVAFLTIVPVRFRKLPQTRTVARSRFWFPVVGLLLGGLLGGWTALVGTFSSPILGAFLVVLAWVGVTGALHLDGAADLCDGLFTALGPEERLRVMKDPQVGAFGVVGVLLLLLGKFAALFDVMSRPHGLAPPAVMLAVWVSRVLIFAMAADASYPREIGTGKVLVEATRLRDPLMLGWLLATAIFLIAALGPLAGGLLLAVPLLSVLALRCLCEGRLGGVTGDCLGAGIEVAELSCLLTASFLAGDIGLALVEIRHLAGANLGFPLVQ